jgi:uncharacterized protein (DUF488 family)
MEFYTIGVYNSDKEQFFNKLIKNGIDTFCDIRQRRGVRGREYSFVNSNRLQATLHEIGITYCYLKELAPTQEIRDLQKAADKENKELKRDRQKLGVVFTENYNNKILSTFNINGFINQLKEIGANKVVLFCVEEHHGACHRSLVTDKISSELKLNIQHL